MPYYDFICNTCGQTIEIEKKNSDPDPVIDEQCESKKCDLKRCYDTQGFILKGTGWFRDGYSSSKKINSDSQ